MQAQFGKYVLLQKLGDGGMSEVFLAQIQGPGGFTKLVALKRMLPHLNNDPLFTTSFINEARLGGYLNHHNIVQTIEFGNHEGNYYLAMEYVRGVTLNEILQAQQQRGTRLPIGLAIEIGIQTAEGLAYAHKADDAEGRPLKMIHRDLKPSNVLINQHGVCKIADFGVARAESNINKTVAAGEVKGTVSFMSPEQAMGRRDLDHRSDIYSIGAILFEMFTNERLYPQTSYLAVLRAVQDGEIADRLSKLLELEEGVRLFQIVSKALAYNPNERYQTALELVRDLRQVGLSFDFDLELADYLKQLLPNSPLTMRGTMVDIPVGPQLQAHLEASQPRAPQPRAPQPQLQAVGLALQSADGQVAQPRQPPPPPIHPGASSPRHRMPGTNPPSTPGQSGGGPVSDWGRQTPPSPGPLLQEAPAPSYPQGVEMPMAHHVPEPVPEQDLSQTMPPRKQANAGPKKILIATAALLLLAVGIFAGRTFLGRGAPPAVPVTSLPLGATIQTTDGRVLGTTPAKITIPEEGLTVTLVLDNYKPAPVQLTAALAGREVLVRLTRIEASLTLNITPGEVQVVVNGQKVMGPPFNVNGLTAGKHRIRVQKDGYQPFEQTLTLEQGESFSMDINLESAVPRAKLRREKANRANKTGQQPPHTRTARAHNKSPKPATKKPAPSRTQNKSPGYLTINAFPYAKVSVDGKPLRNTPILRLPVSPGSHTVTLTTADGQERRLTMDVKSGQTTKEIVHFE